MCFLRNFFLKTKLILSLFFFWSIILSISASPIPDEKIKQQEILHAVNVYRLSKGLPPLQLNADISQEARRHSEEMATHKLPFGHQYFDQRIERIYHKIPHARAGAENIAYNYKDLKVLVQGWIHSPGHRQNIIGHYNLTGIGVAKDAQGKWYYTQLFIRN